MANGTARALARHMRQRGGLGDGGNGGGKEHGGRVKARGADGNCAAGWDAMEIERCRVPVAAGIAY